MKKVSCQSVASEVLFSNNVTDNLGEVNFQNLVSILLTTRINRQVEFSIHILSWWGGGGWCVYILRKAITITNKKMVQ